MIKKAILYFLAFLLLLAGGLFMYIQLKSEEMPALKSGEEAEQLAKKMLKAINFDAWDSTAYVSWSFSARNHDYVWDKKQHLVEVRWEKYRVLVSPNDGKSVVYIQGVKTTIKEEIDKLTEIALAHFNNDSFWLNAPAKLFDAGTTRSIATLPDGSTALAVKYSSGGNTPGDHYLWMLDENFRPKAWKIWASIVPIGGAEFSWDDWIQTSTGTWISQNHHSSLLDVPIDRIRTGMTLPQIGKEVDLFQPLINN